MHRYRIVTIFTVHIGLSVGLYFLIGKQHQHNKTFLEIVAEKPAPNLRTLAERAAPDRNGPDATEAFYDLLKLREQPDQLAVPVLERILNAFAGSNHIDHFAAAQALFAIGTPQAHEILARYLLTPAYSAFNGIKYAFYHEMNPALRDDFIERYHLHNLAKDVSLILAVKLGNNSSLLFTVTVTNISANALSLRDRAHYLASMLYLRSKAGSLIPAKMNGIEFEAAPMKWIHLSPGAQHEWRITMKIRSVRELEQPYLRLSKDVRIVLDTADMYFEIWRPGRFQAIAMLEEQPPAQAPPPSGDGSVYWTGRAVSVPVPLEIYR